MNREVCGVCWCPYDDNGACGYHNDDPLAATRRAIVRAAAEIGKAQSAARIGRQMK